MGNSIGAGDSRQLFFRARERFPAFLQQLFPKVGTGVISNLISEGLTMFGYKKIYLYQKLSDNTHVLVSEYRTYTDALRCYLRRLPSERRELYLTPYRHAANGRVLDI